MRLARRLRPGLTLFGVAVLLGSMAAVQADITEPMVTPFAVAAVFAIVIGEQVPMQFSQRVIAPLTTAPALGLILAPLGASSGEVPRAWTVLAVIWLSILVGGLVARRRQVGAQLGSRAGGAGRESDDEGCGGDGERQGASRASCRRRPSGRRWRCRRSGRRGRIP